MQILYRWIVLLLVCFCLVAKADSGGDGRVAVVMHINGAIGPAVQEYIEDGFNRAADEEADLVVLQIDTPGGLSKSMRGIIQAMLSAPIPTVVYVAPSGARAASAGTYLLYAANIAAMAPGTNIGAATPVNLMGGQSKDKKTGKPSASEMKALNDAKAYIRSLAQMRNRNVHWGELAVTKAASLSAKEALKNNVIDVIAPTIPSLLQQIDGHVVTVQSRAFRLDTKDMAVMHFQPSWRSKLLSIITDPTIAYIFLIIAFYGLFFEFAHPGLFVPGVIGGIALVLALYGLQLLPINYVGLGLIILGFLFFVGEAFVPSFGMLGLGGIICFVIGSIMLLDTDVKGFSIPWQLITGVSVVTALFVLGLVQMVFRVRRRPKMSGDAVLIGQVGEVLCDRQQVWLRINGELWQVTNPEGLQHGQRVKVLAVSALKVTVESPKQEKNS